MFGWGKKNNSAVVEAVCQRIRPLFGILEHRLGGLSLEVANNPYVIGYIVGSASIFAQIETSGKASTELRGLVSLAALQTAFASLNFSMQQASAAMQRSAGNAEAKRGSRAADLIIGVASGKTDRDYEPEIVEAKAAILSMPEPIKKMLGGTPQSQLLGELQEKLFFEPIEAWYRK